MFLLEAIGVLLASVAVSEMAWALLDTIADRVDNGLPVNEQRLPGQVNRRTRAYMYLVLSLCTWCIVFVAFIHWAVSQANASASLLEE